MNIQVGKKILDARSVGVNVEGVDLLADISLDIQPGEIVALVGPNGSGKSTFLRAVTGEQKTCSGEISFNYKDLSGWNRRDLARNLAVLPQQSVLNFPFTGREVVSLARTPHDTGNQIDTEIVDQVLDYLDANYLADRLYPRLSGGEQQRIQLARVLAQIWDKADQPRLLLLDEPSSYFDLAHQQMLIELVHQLAQRNIAVLIVLHDINMAMACSDRIAVLSCGRLKAFGKTDEVITPELLKSVFSVEARFVIDPETGERFMTMPGSSRRSLAAGETE